jgi:hypothetical protein
MDPGILHRGGCHCGAVRFEVRAPRRVTVQRCNCSICTKTAYQHLIVPGAGFTLTAGADRLATYTFNTGVAKHLFCRTCGVKSFYVPRSNPDGFSVNLRCIDAGTIDEVVYEDFDGRHWEQHGAALAHLTARDAS